MQFVASHLKARKTLQYVISIIIHVKVAFIYKMHYLMKFFYFSFRNNLMNNCNHLLGTNRIPTHSLV